MPVRRRCIYCGFPGTIEQLVAHYLEKHRQSNEIITRQGNDIARGRENVSYLQ